MARTSRKNRIVVVSPDGESLKVGLYVRLSDEDNGRKGKDSVFNQLNLLQEFVGNAFRKEADCIYIDGYSGTNFERPGVKRLLSLVKEGKVCCIMVKDISRFGRNFLEVSDYLEQIFPFLEVRFIAVNDGYDSGDYIGTTGE